MSALIALRDSSAERLLRKVRLERRLLNAFGVLHAKRDFVDDAPKVNKRIVFARISARFDDRLRP